MNRYPRDFHGYGASTPSNPWPNAARIAVQFVVNYEEGGERSLLHGDDSSEAFLSEIIGAEPWPGQRHWNMESLYDYGARAGFWRLHRLFTDCGIPVTVFGVATALARSPAQVAAMHEAGWEIAWSNRTEIVLTLTQVTWAALGPLVASWRCHCSRQASGSKASKWRSILSCRPSASATADRR
jgi:hypothetical protein